MWILKRLFLILVVALILLLGVFNAAEQVTVKLGFTEFPESPLPLVMVVFFLLGAIFHYLYSIGREITLRAEIRRLKRGSEGLSRELTDLRNLSIEEGFEQEPPEEVRE
jgi:uncharacterized integral membrane protein